MANKATLEREFNYPPKGGDEAGLPRIPDWGKGVPALEYANLPRPADPPEGYLVSPVRAAAVAGPMLPVQPLTAHMTAGAAVAQFRKMTASGVPGMPPALADHRNKRRG